MRKRVSGVLIVGCLFLLVSLHSEEMTIQKIKPNISVIMGAGGNILVNVGKEELLVVDSGYGKSAEAVLKKIKSISPLPIGYLIITHYHGDHTGGKGIIGKGAEIICHENCLASMMREKAAESERYVKPKMTTFRTDYAMAWNSRGMSVIHPDPCHTSGDAVVIFSDDKMIHVGDMFFNGLPPYIDVKDGSNTKSWIEMIHRLARLYPDYTVVPGHGSISDMKGWKKFADYLQYLRDMVQKGIQNGKTKEEIQKSADLTPYKDLKEKEEFLTIKNNLGWIYDEMNRK